MTNRHQLHAICFAYEQGVGHAKRDLKNPYGIGSDEHWVWDHGREAAKMDNIGPGLKIPSLTFGLGSFKEESLKLISMNIKIHDANVLLRSDPPEPNKALENLIEVMEGLIPLMNIILERMTNGGINDEPISSLRDNET